MRWTTSFHWSKTRKIHVVVVVIYIRTSNGLATNLRGIAGLSEIEASASSEVVAVENLTRCWLVVVALASFWVWDDNLGVENAEACLATSMRLELATRNPNIM